MGWLPRVLEQQDRPAGASEKSVWWGCCARDFIRHLLFRLFVRTLEVSQDQSGRFRADLHVAVNHVPLLNVCARRVRRLALFVVMVFVAAC